jgi:type I restriction enzyme S subunit
MCLETTDKVSSDFGYQFLNTYDLLKIIYGYGSGLRQNLDFSEIKLMPVLVPPKFDQSAIVRFLRHLDHRIRGYILAKQRLIKLLQEQKKATIHRAVTQGVDPDVVLKSSGVEWLGEIPEHWDTWQIGFFARVGNGSTPSRSNSEYWSGGRYPWLNSSSVNQNPIVATNQFVTDIALKECHLPQVQPGSVLVAITGQGKTRGTAAILDIEATINQHIAYITPQRDVVSTDFLYLALVGAYRELRRISDDSGSTKGALTCGDLSHFKIAVPPSGEQDQIVAVTQQQTQSADAAISQAEREISLLREYRTRFIADVVTGKLDVTEAVANLSDEAEGPGELPFADDVLEGTEDLDLPSDEVAEEEVVA